MPTLPFDPVELAPAFPDVLWAVGIAFILALVTHRPQRGGVIEEGIASIEVVEDADFEEIDGS